MPLKKVQPVKTASLKSEKNADQSANVRWLGDDYKHRAPQMIKISKAFHVEI